MCLHVGEASTSLVCLFYLGHDALTAVQEQSQLFWWNYWQAWSDGSAPPLQTWSLRTYVCRQDTVTFCHPCSYHRLSEFGADGRCQIEHGPLALCLHAAGLTSFSTALAKGCRTRASTHTASSGHG